MSFFVLDQRTIFDTTKFAHYKPVEPTHFGDPPTCSACGAMMAASPWLPPHDAKRSRGKLGDFVFGPMDELFASEKAWSQIEEASLVGLDLVATSGASSIFGSGFVLLRPKARRVPVDDSRVTWRTEATCTVCGSRSWSAIDGAEVDESNWDGTDLFQTTFLPGVIIVSERVSRAMRSFSWTNFPLVPALSYRVTLDR